MEINIAVSKIDRFGVSTSGDTVEAVERPNGGISVVLADGEANGESHKSISTMVAHRVVDHISHGMRDGASIREASNRIFAEHDGKIRADLNVISVDLQTNTLLISRNSPVPVFLIDDEKVDCLASESTPIGFRENISPTIVELSIRPGMAIIVFSNGVYQAGRKDQHNPDICTTLEALIEGQDLFAQEIADFLLNRSIRLDDGRPKDDMSVVVLLVTPESKDQIRRMNVSFTLDSLTADGRD